MFQKCNRCGSLLLFRESREGICGWCNSGLGEVPSVSADGSLRVTVREKSPEYVSEVGGSVLIRRVHCWHAGESILLSDPPQHDEKCCFCGAMRHVSHRRLTEGHGSYVHLNQLPLVQVYSYPIEVDENYCQIESKEGKKQENVMISEVK